MSGARPINKTRHDNKKHSTTHISSRRREGSGLEGAGNSSSCGEHGVQEVLSIAGWREKDGGAECEGVTRKSSGDPMRLARNSDADSRPGKAVRADRHSHVTSSLGVKVPRCARGCRSYGGPRGGNSTEARSEGFHISCICQKD